MRNCVIRSVNSLLGRPAYGRVIMSLLAFVLLAPACARMDDRVTMAVASMERNRAFVTQHWEDVKVGEPLPSDVAALMSVGRVRVLAWDLEQTVGAVLRVMRQPTHDPIDCNWPEVKVEFSRHRLVRDLPLATQEYLRATWTMRLQEALGRKYYTTHSNALTEALKGNHLAVFYLLVNRFDTAEMGHKDVVRFFMQNKDGVVVSKIKGDYGISYPLGFVDESRWPHEFLY